ncbi:ZNF845 [Symbiodinium microadriaticum]|nr:ZNF845 [Symbiodinium microadriaticum]
MPLSEPDAKERSAACRVRVHDLMSSGDRDTFCTEVLVQMTDMEACSLGNGGNGGEVTIAGRGLRDFAKATDAIAKDLAHMGLLDGSALLELHFGDQGGSVLCCMAAGCDGTARPMQDFSAVFMVSTRESSSSGAAPGAAPATRRALEAAPSDFGAFPEPNSQAPRSEASARAPEKLPSTQVTQSESVRDAARPLLQLFTQQQKSELLASQAWHAPKSPKPEVAATCPSTPVSREPHKTEQTAEAAPVPPTPNRNYQVPSSGPWWPGGVLPQPQPKPSVPKTQPTLAANLQARDSDSDDELIGADPDEVALARGDLEESVDWFDCEASTLFCFFVPRAVSVKKLLPGDALLNCVPDSRSFKCDHPGCNKAYKRKVDLEDHKAVHLEVKPFRCTVESCDRSFTTKQSLMSHIGRVHNGLSCTACGLRFRKKAKLQQHWAIVHGARGAHEADGSKVDPGKCPDCGKTFQHRESLEKRWVHAL